MVIGKYTAYAEMRKKNLIFKEHVEKVSKDFLVQCLQEQQPSLLDFLMHPDRFPKFVDRCYEACNERESAMFMAGESIPRISDRKSLDDYIQRATQTYAALWFNKIEGKLP